jgi:quercetin dioxygenase-like cupin family protein
MSQADRLRPHPEKRFAETQTKFDLDDAYRSLMSEVDSGQHGHRQMALFRHGPATVAIYHFEEGAYLKDHSVDGPVILHTLTGRLTVKTDQAEHELSAGAMLALAPGVRHDVSAHEDARMLLTVCLEGPGSHP